MLSTHCRARVLSSHSWRDLAQSSHSLSPLPLLSATRGGRVFLPSYQLGGSDTLQESGVTSPGPGELRMAGMGSAFNKSHNGSGRGCWQPTLLHQP